MRVIFVNTLAVLATVIVAALLGEGLLRIKHRDQTSYTVEMWRYAKELKKSVADAAIEHRHIPSRSAQLQNTTISINSFGMRGPEPALEDPNKIKVLLLGSSITLGWGVPEEQTLRSLLDQRLGDSVTVLNAGVGNYNAERYVNLFVKHLKSLKPDVIVVHYFVNDAEVLPPSTGNWLMRNSQLALMLWQAAVNVTDGRRGLVGLETHYRDVYAEGSEGRKRMEQALKRLDQAAKSIDAEVVLAMMPDIHNLASYPFGFIHSHMRNVAEGLKWTYVDLLTGFEGVLEPKELFAIPGDPHPNGRGHATMADVLTPVLKQLLGRKSKS